MQRGQPISIDRFPPNQYIYNIICRKLNQNRANYDNSSEENKKILNVEFKLLEELRRKIENPDYYDEVM